MGGARSRKGYSIGRDIVWEGHGIGKARSRKGYSIGRDIVWEGQGLGRGTVLGGT